eukprot:s3371_g2.t1
MSDQSHWVFDPELTHNHLHAVVAGSQGQSVRTKSCGTLAYPSIPSCDTATTPQQEPCHDQTTGVRIGEASHPGPHSKGKPTRLSDQGITTKLEILGQNHAQGQRKLAAKRGTLYRRERQASTDTMDPSTPLPTTGGTTHPAQHHGTQPSTAATARALTQAYNPQLQQQRQRQRSGPPLQNDGPIWLRQKDWSDPVMQYDNLATHLTNHKTRAIIQCRDQEQGQAAAAMLTTITLKAAWIIWRQADATTTLPGQCGSKPILQRVICNKLVDPGQNSPTHPEILRVIFDNHYTSKRTSSLAAERPRKALGDWVQTLPPPIATTIQDTWGWKQQHSGSNHATIGLIRVEGTFGAGDSPDLLVGRSG